MLQPVLSIQHILSETRVGICLEVNLILWPVVINRKRYQISVGWYKTY